MDYYEYTWEKERDKRYVFPVVTDSIVNNINKFHPLKQRQIDAIYRKLIFDERIKRLVIFGSCTNMRCNQRSDIDIAISLKEEYSNLAEARNEISLIIQTSSDWDADIIWIDHLNQDEHIHQEIAKGVCLI